MVKQRANREENKRVQKLQGKVSSDISLAEWLGLAQRPPPVKVEAGEAPRPICPLCKFPITLKEGKDKNCAPIEYNGRLVVVHRTCPAEA